MAAIQAQAGPSRLRQASTTTDTASEPREDVDDPRATTTTPAAGNAKPAEPEEGDEDEERMDLKAIESIANKVQYAEGGTRPKIVIPKRGEKDFEPLQETVNLQEMMLGRSREALFNALVGVRGGNSKSMSHALLTPGSTYPRMLVTRGHIFNTLGISVRHPPKFGKKETYNELLPEEALYLLERGSLQIWVGPEAETETDNALGVGTWKDEEWGVSGAVEMSVMEGYGVFIGKEGLTWERYQAYAYLKRLGYTVQRAPRFVPDYFDPPRLHPQAPALPPFKSWWTNLPHWMSHLVTYLGRTISSAVESIAKVGLDLTWTRKQLKGTLLWDWRGANYSSLFSRLRIVPTGHHQPLPARSSAPLTDSIYSCLDRNPYIPFFHIWKPATPWSKSKWDKGSEEGLIRQKPDFFAAIVDARTVPMPSIHQLDEVFRTLPDEPKGPPRRVGPQYERKPRPPRPGGGGSGNGSGNAGRDGWSQWLDYLPAWMGGSPAVAPSRPGGGGGGNPMGALRNGDRALVVAVNDSGNTGWVRFGRTGFAEAAVM